MQVDLLTLYLLAVGTLFATAGMTYWEHRTNALRAGPLRILAAGFAILAVGCAAALVRRQVPHGIGSAIANLLVLTGYLRILAGIAAISGRRYRRWTMAVLGTMAVAWAIGGPRAEDQMWSYGASVAIAVVSGLTAWEMHRCDAMKSLSARYIVVVMAGIHAVFYAARALILPWAVGVYGTPLLVAVSKITLYEGVLYSVVLPMALLKLVRDESHGELLRESQTDYLTRLGNRRSFFEQGTAMVDRMGCRGPIAVLAFDLDRFKAINDVHGHQAGDEVLKRFADTVRRVLGDEAIVARIGGEEFAALRAGGDARRAAELGEEVARRFAETMRDPHDGPGIGATVSVGLAFFADAVPSLPAALATADRALYAAKAQGGNRVVVA